MTGRSEALTKTYLAGAAVNPYRFIKMGAADETVVQAAAVSDPIIGASDSLGAAATNDRVDVIHTGIVSVKAGGTITRGNPVTSDASGQAVAAAPSAGANNYIGGLALASAVSGDLFPVLLSPGRIQG